MPQSLVKNYIHIVYSTKNRQSLIDKEIEAARNNIINQDKHHTKKTFQEEYWTILKKFNVEYNEKYVWD